MTNNTHTIEYGKYNITIRVPRQIDNSMINAVYMNLDHSAIIEGMTGIKVNREDEPEKFAQVIKMVSDELFTFSSIVVLLSRDVSVTSEDVIEKFPDMFTPYSKLTDAFIDMYVNSNSEQLHKVLTDGLNQVFALQSSRELAPKEYLDPN